PEYWRSLEELADTEEFRELLQREYPRQAAAWMESLDRRQFLKVMGASLALAGLGACRNPAPAPKDEKIVPYINQPEEIIPGKPLFFATAMPLNGYGRGVLAESHMGRPTKIEGNPAHPASLGATDVFMQASVLDLYDPDRSPALLNAGRISTWSAFFAAINAELETQRLNRGAGLRILTETVTSPTLGAQLKELLTHFPKAQWHQYAPVGRDAALEGSRLAFGDVVEMLYRFDHAEVVLSLDSDFLFFGPGALRYAREFADKRRVSDPKGEMNRLYVVESTPTVTGSMADHRLPLAPDAIEKLAQAVARALGVSLGHSENLSLGVHEKWVMAVVRDLQRHRGRSVVVAGDQQPPVVHALAHAMNHALGNVGQTVSYTEPVEIEPVNQTESLLQLVRDLEANRVQLLVIIGGNPAYTAPADVNFAGLLVKSNFTVHLSSHVDETSALSHWHVPQAHYLESWSDVRAFDGTASIIQPLIAPLYRGRTAHELVAAVLGQPGKSSYDIVRGYWQQQSRGKDFEEFWRRSVHDGVVAGTEAPVKRVSLKAISLPASGNQKSTEKNAAEPQSGVQENEQRAKSKEQRAESREPAWQLLFRPDPTIFDGAFANNGWLQETPKPLTKLTWDNVVLVSPATADRLQLSAQFGVRGGEHGTVDADVVELEYQGRRVKGAVWIFPGQADDCVTVYLGHGRTRAGRVGTHMGFNANALRTSDALWNGVEVRLRKTGERSALACTQFHHMMEGRHLLRSATLKAFRENPNVVQDVE
ncbi:MAG TPA: TAT-variant-translocated molybdopterin oxidoreductase, partial [Terriglobales bacterium]|nr:TAT-variant-translocated molybdopterin oxidoreductase [Terriglobales bacterium]